MITLAIGLLIGLVLGLTGAGGSVFAVPLLIFGLGLVPQDAIGLALGAVATAAILGTLSKLKSKEIIWLPAVVFALVGALIAPLGVYIGQQIPAMTLMILFSVLVLIIALRMWIQAYRQPEATKAVRANLHKELNNPLALCRLNAGKSFELKLPCILGVSVAAIFTGLLSGIFGVGGGFLIVPALVFLLGVSIHTAVASSLFIISLISTSGFISYLSTAESIDYSILAMLSLSGMVGMLVGIFLSRFIAGPNLQKLFSILMIIIAGFSLYKQFAL